MNGGEITQLYDRYISICPDCSCKLWYVLVIDGEIGGIECSDCSFKSLLRDEADET
jgi:hypothetical protein